ncbi:unnamed protein product [Trifolium pratense]|uniref:Uncharacterized protein n=1 Tax=Trifolium pratense TaxID=57577 RepID=A0ACB0I9N8_TRIPR|nr:unnamed protein product [Trifolium pratense]
MAAGDLDYSIRKKLDTQHLRDMAQLADRVRQVERLKAEKARSSKHQRQQKLSLQETQKTENNKGKQVVKATRRPLKERLSQPLADQNVDDKLEEENLEDEDLLDSDPEFDVLVNVVSILPAEYDVWSEVAEGEDEFDESETGFSLGAIQVDVAVGSTVRPTLFLVVASKANYNLLLGREWIHGVGAVPSTLHQRISAYMAENKINMALEATMLQENMAVEANDCENGKTLPTIQKLDCIYDEEPLGFEKDPSNSSQKMQAQDPLEEIDIGDGSIKRPTYISANIPKDLRDKLVELLKEFKDCFAWDYNEMPGIEINQNKTKAILETKPPTNKKQLQSLLGKINFLRRFISNLSGKAQAFSPLLRLKKEDVFTWGQDQQEAFDEIKKYLSNPPTLMPPIRNKFMKLYISASNTTLGSMLAQEDENGEEKAIYYLSRVLNDVETRYSSIEKLCLCLYFSCMKLKHYIKPIDVYVYSHYDVIKHMLLKPILHSRIGRWALALSEYSLSYKPLKAIKGQIVADFIVDHSAIESPQNYVVVEPWILYFDGSKHQHGTGIGVLIISPQKIPTKFKYKINGICSNNEAEYEALIAGLEILLSLGAKDIKIKGDSELVLKQLTKEYKCIKEHLIRYFVIANALLKRFDSIDIEHVPRIENQEANDLAQIAYGYKVSKEKLEQLVEIKDKLISQEPMHLELSTPKLGGAHMSHSEINNSDQKMDCNIYDEFQVFVIDNLVNGDWRKPIVEYLENPIGNTPRKIKYRASNYVIIGNELFKKTLEGILLKCLSETEAYIAISDVHSGACGSHQSGHKMKWLLFRQGMYWPSMLKDCIDFAKGCQECQKHAGIQHVPASELHSIIKPWPFRGWALDLIGEIKPASSKNQKYIIVGIDYFTKWIEAIPLPNVDQEEVISFIQNHIIYRFGIPETITTDQGSVFTGRKMQEFARQTGFKLLTSTPYYAQANGQVEAANKIIIGLIRKHIAQKPRNWNKTLNQVLWACRNSPKESTNSTPFRLTYGHDAVLPVEIYLQSIRIQRQMEIPTDHYWSMMFDELVDLDEERLRALDTLSRQKERVAKAYNKKVKSKTFEVGNLVWKKK